LHDPSELSDQAVIAAMDQVHARICAEQRRLLGLIAVMDRREEWANDGARDMAHWLWMRYGLSDWKARRWIAAAHALERLPAVSEAFASGVLGIDKVVELTRFATPSTESDLISWAERVAPGAIRHRGDVEARREAERERADATYRSLSYEFHSEGRRLTLHAELPAAEGSLVVHALQARAQTIPVLPGEEHDHDARMADALVAACTDPSSDGTGVSATIVVHTTERFGAAGAIEGGGIVAARTLERLRCGARIQLATHAPDGDPLRIGRASREPTLAMVRALRHRDRECVFPACGFRRFTQAHHIRWWSHGGGTDIENLTLLCHFHHALVHEHGWRITRPPGGPVRWYRPDGTRYRAGPARPAAAIARIASHEALAGSH
jgi:hypothetical protein